MNSKQYKEIVSSCKKYENDPLPSGFSSYELLTTLFCMRASLSALTVKNLPAMWETQVQFLSQEDPLEKEMASHTNILAWRIPRTEEPGKQHPWDCKELDMTK